MKQRLAIAIIGIVLLAGGYVLGSQLGLSPGRIHARSAPPAAPSATPLMKEFTDIGIAGTTGGQLRVQVVRFSGGGQPEETILRIGIDHNRDLAHHRFRERAVIALKALEARAFLAQLDAVDAFVKAGRGKPRTEIHARAGDLSIVAATKDDGVVSPSIYVMAGQSDEHEVLGSLDKLRGFVRAGLDAIEAPR